ncbi:unnamed protein product [Pylaiella littoralis]
MASCYPPPAAPVTCRKRGVVAELTIAKSGQSAPLTAISTSSDQRHAVVGGHGIMKVIRLAPEGLSEVATLKTGRHKITGNAGSKLSMYDVAWCPSGGHVAASLSNGGVAIWDLQHISGGGAGAGPGERAGSGQGRSHGYHGQGGGLLGSGASLRGMDTGKIIGTHERSVNRLCWNPFDHAQLLSGSQDGFLKIWDVRSSKEIACFNSNFGAVRDVQYSPLQEFHFAAVFNNGKLQIWDYRIPHPKMKISSHNKSVRLTVWHSSEGWKSPFFAYHRPAPPPPFPSPPQSSLLVARIKPIPQSRGPLQVSRAKWRPGHSDQIATAQAPLVGEKDYAIMVHDVTDPAVALYAVYGGDDKKNGFCWLDTPLNVETPGGVLPSPLSAAAAAAKARRIAGSSGRDEYTKAERGGIGVWQHLVSCSDQGTVRVHSLAKSTLPRRNVEVRGTRGFTTSARGEMCSWLHKRNDDPTIWKIYQNEQTQAAPGMYREEMMEFQSEESRDRKRSSSAHYPVALAPPLQQQPAAGITQLQQQRIARSLSVGDQTGGVKGRRTGGAASATSSAGVLWSVGASPSGQRTATGLPRSPNLGRQHMSGAPTSVPHLRLGSGMASSPSEDSPPPRARRARSTLTIYPVPDKPVALDVVHWRRIRNKEQRCFYGRSQPWSGAQGGYGPELTEHLTRSVVLRGYHVRVLAAHNAEVYLQAGLESMAHTWRMVGIMLSGVPGGLLLPLGARIPDIDVAGIDAGVAAAVAAARDAAGGGAGEWAAKDKMAGAGGGREFDANVGRERDFSVPEVLDLIDKHEEEEEEEGEEPEEEEKEWEGERGQQLGRPARRMTPEQRQQQLHLGPPPPKPSRTTSADCATAGDSDNPRLPPKRPPAALSPSAAAAGPAAAANTTSLESVSSSSRHGSKSGGGGGGGSSGGVTSGGTGLSSLSMWHPQPLRGAARPNPTAAGTATTVTGDDIHDDNDREDSDGETTTTTTFAATEVVWWENTRPHRGGGGGGSDGLSSSLAVRAAAAAGGGNAINRDGRPERQERLSGEVTLDWLWKSEIRDELTMMAEAGFAYDTVAILEVVR